MRLGNNFRVLASCAHLEIILNCTNIIPFTLGETRFHGKRTERSEAPQYMILQIRLHIASMVHSGETSDSGYIQSRTSEDKKMFFPAHFHKLP